MPKKQLQDSRFFPLRQALFLTFGLLGSLTATAQESSTPNVPRIYNRKLVQILEGYQELINKPEKNNEGKDRPGEDWQLLAKAIEKGFLRFTISPNENRLIGGSYFRAVPNSNVTHVILSKAFINAWVESRSLVYVLLARTLHEAAFFFRDPEEWHRTKSDAVENSFLIIDEYSLVSQFILYRLQPYGLELGEYEKFILESYKTDKLAGAMLFLERLAVPVAATLNLQRLEFEKSERQDLTRNSVIKLGKTLAELREKLSSTTNELEVYAQAVAIHTWLELSPLVISRINNKNRTDDALNFSKILNIETDYAQIRRELEDFRIRDMPLINHTYKSTLEGFEQL